MFLRSSRPPASVPRPNRGARRSWPRLALLLLALAVSTRLPATTATYLVTSGSITQTSQNYTASATDTSAVGVNGTGHLTLANCTLATTGNTSSSDSSSFTGLNAGLLVDTGGVLTMTGGSVTTTGTGANGIFAYATGTATVTDVTVDCTGRYAHAVMCAGGGTLTVANLTALTRGQNSGAIATDRGGGTISLTGGTIKTTGADSPAVYSTGAITVANARLTATASEAVVIEGLNHTTLSNCDATGNSATYGAVLVVQSQSGDASVGTASFNMTGGSLTAEAGPLFFVTNTDAAIALTSVALTAPSGILLTAAGTSRWGTSGANGGHVTLTASGQALVGDLAADSLSSITAYLKNGSTLSGAVSRAALTLDATSTWIVTGGSTLTQLTTAGTVAFADVSQPVTITGTATLAGHLTLTPPTIGGTYTLLTAGTLSGTFASYSFSPALATGLTSSLAYSENSVTITVSGTATANTLVIATPPTGHMVAAGRTAAFSVAATSTAGTILYQWRKNGAALPGATAPQLLLPAVTAAAAGAYSVTVTDINGSLTSDPAALQVVASDDPGRIVNLSVLAASGADSDVLIVGFVLGGADTSGTRSVLVRGMGPSLAPLGVSSPLADPILRLSPLGAGTTLATNDNWSGDATLRTTAAAVGAFAFIDAASTDAALLLPLSAGAYTAVVSGVNNTTGTTLAEVYDAAPTVRTATPRLINISARGAVGTTALTAGFVISGSTATTVLLRGLGPYLTTAGLTGAVANPKITLYRSVNGTNTTVATNDDWNLSAPIASAAATVGAAAISSASEAALLLTLDPGVYSFGISDAAGSTGQALVEAYEVP